MIRRQISLCLLPFQYSPMLFGPVPNNKFISLLLGKIDHVKIEWIEDKSKQHYDQKLRISKIGETSQPFIKKLVEQKKDPLVTMKKIGEDPQSIRIKKRKEVDSKIGHANGEFHYTKKPREDGYLTGIKEINGENYQTSKFFY